MEQLDHLQLTCETVIIEGGRKLYRYTFELESEDDSKSSPSAKTPVQEEPENKQ